MDPVCGSDTKTYGNKCEFENAKCKNTSLSIVHEGRCECMKACPKIWRPVCGSDGKTYANECDFEIAKCNNPLLTITHQGVCKGKDAIPLILFCWTNASPQHKIWHTITTDRVSFKLSS